MNAPRTASNHIASWCLPAFNAGHYAHKLKRQYGCTTANQEKIYRVAFQMIDETELKGLNTGFNLSGLGANGNGIDLEIEHRSKGDPTIKACWVGSVGGGFWPKTPPNILSVFLTGGKFDYPLELETDHPAGIIFSVYAERIKNLVHLDLNAFAQDIKEKNKMFDKDARVIFNLIHPCAYAKGGNVNLKSTKVNEQYYQRIAMIKFTELMAINENTRIECKRVCLQRDSIHYYEISRL